MIATDGLASYAIFTYKCGELNWMDKTTIGFSITQDFFENHALSQTPNVNDIACLNSPNSTWSNVVYRTWSDVVYHVKGCNNSTLEFHMCSPPCINGQCINGMCLCDNGWSGAQCSKGRCYHTIPITITYILLL